MYSKRLWDAEVAGLVDRETKLQIAEVFRHKSIAMPTPVNVSRLNSSKTIVKYPVTVGFCKKHYNTKRRDSRVFKIERIEL